MTENAKFTRKIAGSVTPEAGLLMHKQKQTGWPAIAILAFVFAGVFGCGCVISGKSVEQFYREWAILVWLAAGFLALCMVAELSCLKCPSCRSRAITLVSEEEVDRWIGQKIVNEDTVGVGGFQTFGGPKFKRNHRRRCRYSKDDPGYEEMCSQRVLLRQLWARV
jgi:hypothetical protein